MAIHHIFPDGKLSMDGLSSDLSNMTAEQALAELDRLDDLAFDIWKDFGAQITEARDRIQNTGSIFGNARAVALASPEDNPKVCGRCLGSGGIHIAHTDTGESVWNTCPTCGGTCHAGPVVLRSDRTRGYRQPYRCQTCGHWHIGGGA